MKSSVLFALASAVLLTALPLRATPLDDCIAELKHAIGKEAAARGANVAPNGFNPGANPAFLNAAIDQMVAQMEDPANGANMDAQLTQITSVYTSDEVQEASTNLLNEIRKERQARIEAEIAGLKALIARAGDEIPRAKKPEDLDDLITAMGRHENNRFGGGPAPPGNEQLGQQFSSAFQFVKEWQDYLAHLASGQVDLARNDLANLSQNNYGASLIPRSKLLELQAPNKLTPPAGQQAPSPSSPDAQAQAILEGMKTLDDLQPALKQLAVLRQGNMGGNVQFAYNILAQMEQNYLDLKAGLPASGSPNYNYNPGGINVPPALRAQLLLLTLQSRFASFQGKAPAPDEKPAAFVDRVIADATSREDWELLRLAEEARGSVTSGTPFGYAGSNLNGVESLIAASHQEAAGQLALAVQSYQIALKSSDPAIPARFIGDRLAAIQRDHPKEFADGMQLTTEPPAPRLYQNPAARSFNPASPPAPAPIPPTLLSPAASTNTATTPAK